MSREAINAASARAHDKWLTEVGNAPGFDASRPTPEQEARYMQILMEEAPELSFEPIFQQMTPEEQDAYMKRYGGEAST